MFDSLVRSDMSKYLAFMSMPMRGLLEIPAHPMTHQH
jgi:hypothetical protein